MANIRLIVGLGNPGAEYESTRHNVGAWLVEELASDSQQQLRAENKFSGLFAPVQINSHKCYLLEPTTFMNDSGQAVQAAAKFYKINPSEILVAHDELDLSAGTARIKLGGGHGGHNGLRDIINHLHTKEFYRLRIGIGHPGHKDKVTPYVLGRPSNQDYERIQTSIREGLRVLPELLTGDVEKAQRLLHVTP